MLIRVRGPEGQATLNFDDECTIDAFRQLLAEKTGVPPAQQEVRGGFPPRLLDFPPDGGAAAVAALGLTSGDSLTVTQLPLPAGASAAAAPSKGAPSNGHAAAPASATVAGLSEDEQLARAIALSLGETVPELPAAAPAQPPVAAAAHAAAVQPARARSPVRAHPASASGKGAATPQGAPVAVPLADGTAVVRRIIDSDNSCLFNAVGYVTQHSRQLAPQLRWAARKLGGPHFPRTSQPTCVVLGMISHSDAPYPADVLSMCAACRRVIADAVMADPHEWNEAVLGKAPAQYRAWILDPSRWGGAIELSILSRHLGREIAAFDIQTTRVGAWVLGCGPGWACSPKTALPQCGGACPRPSSGGPSIPAIAQPASALRGSAGRACCTPTLASCRHLRPGRGPQRALHGDLRRAALRRAGGGGL